jgi:hypothetical protein
VRPAIRTIRPPRVPRTALRGRLVAAAVALAVLAAATHATATHAAAQESSAIAQLDAGSRAAVERAIADARADGLPTEPLTSKVAEGVTKGADGARIAAVVRSLAAAMGAARAALGDGSTTAELVAGAGALQAGVAGDALARLRRTEPRRPVTMPLVVLADLVARGVPSDTAASAVVELSRRGATDVDFASLRRDVVRDIAAGTPAAAAAAMRARQFAPQGAPPGAVRPSGERPPTQGPEPPGA